MKPDACRIFRHLAFTLLTFAFGAFAAIAAESVTVKNLQELRHAIQSHQRRVCDVELNATVCATDPARSLLALQDDTGVEVISLELAGREFHPGDRIRIVANNCALIRRKWEVAFTTPPVVDNGGVHSVSESSGRMALAAGRHPISLFYFNVKNPAQLQVRYTGPGVSPQTIPTGALFLEADRATTNQHGLRFFCYDDMPATLDRARQQTSIYEGITTHFDISVRQPEENVAMQFRGFIEITRPGEYEFTVRSDDAGELYIGELQPEVTKLGTQPPHAAPAISEPSFAAPPEHGAWRTIEGIVTFAGKERDQLEIVLRENSRATRLWLASDQGVPQPLLLNAQIRAVGVYRSAMNLNGEGHAGLFAVIGSTNLQLLEVAPEHWRKNPVITISNAARLAGTEGIITHLRGIARDLKPNGEFLLNDGTAEILVKALAADGLTNGSEVEVLGAVLSSPEGPRIAPAVCRLRESQPAVPPTFTTAAEVQQLSVRDAARQHSVTVRGVITCLVELGGAVVQDSTRGVFFSFEPSYRDGLEPGDFAEIRGATAVGDFAPIIAAQSIRVLGRGQMPEPVRPGWNQLMSGSLDSQYAEVRGIVTEADGNRITLLTDSGKVKVLLNNTSEPGLRKLLNTLVRIRGCLFAVWDSDTRQVRVGEIRFRNPTIEIDQLPMTDPFAAPEKTIPDLLLFDLNASAFERVKISGQVVHVRAGEIFLMQDRKGLRFRLTTDTPLKPGDLVEVVGIPELSGPSPRLHEAVARKVGATTLPAAVPWTNVEQASESPDATRVETESRLIGIHRAGPEWVLELQTGLRAFRARVTSSEALAGEFPLGSQLHLTGVYAAIDGERSGDLAGFELLLNSPEDIRLLQRPPWWTLRRLLFIVASLIAVLTVAAVWISQLRRQVALRTAQLEREHARRERAERERAVEVERTRIARDLHDDLGSSLTEIRVLASAGLRQHANHERTPTLFQAITEKARSMVSALDVIIWAVDSEENTVQSLADYLSGYAAEYLAASDIVCRFKVPLSLPDKLVDGQIRHDLFLAVKETLHNIVRHSQAKEVEFHFEAEPEGIRIAIVDNGKGFDPAAAAREGHGLRNLPERLARMGGRCDVESSPGAGTRVNIFVPVADQQPNPQAN